MNDLPNDNEPLGQNVPPESVNLYDAHYCVWSSFAFNDMIMIKSDEWYGPVEAFDRVELRLIHAFLSKIANVALFIAYSSTRVLIRICVLVS